MTKIDWFVSLKSDNAMVKSHCGGFVLLTFGEQVKTLFLIFNSHIAVRQIGKLRQNRVIEA